MGILYIVMIALILPTIYMKAKQIYSCICVNKKIKNNMNETRELYEKKMNGFKNLHYGMSEDDVFVLLGTNRHECSASNTPDGVVYRSSLGYQVGTKNEMWGLNIFLLIFEIFMALVLLFIIISRNINGISDPDDFILQTILLVGIIIPQIVELVVKVILEKVSEVKAVLTFRNGKLCDMDTSTITF